MASSLSKPSEFGLGSRVSYGKRPAWSSNLPPKGRKHYKCRWPGMGHPGETMKQRHFSWTLVALIALAGPAQAAGGAAGDASGPASQFQMAMTIYAGGITLGKMDIDATVRGNDY